MRASRVMKKQFYILLVFSLLFIRAAAQISPDSLVLYLPFNGDANDYSGNNYNGVIYGAKRTEGFNGQPNTAYYFDGTNSIVIPRVPKLEGPVKAFSVLVRLKPSIVRTGTPFYNFLSWQRHGKDENESYQHGKLRIGWSPPNPNYHPNYDFFGYFGDWCTGNVRTSNGFEADTADANNKWQTIALIYSEGNMRVYFNCRLESDWIDAFPHVADLCGNDPMEILLGSVSPGASADGFRNFIGKLDEVRMYKRALSDAEVKYFADSICAQLFPPELHLTYKANICQPSEFTFRDSSVVTGATVIKKVVWKISNGDSAEGPLLTYQFKQPGTYTVSMNVYAGAEMYSTDTTVHIASVGTPRFLNVAQHNVFACNGTAPQLRVSGGNTYRWSPCTNLSDCNSPAPIVTTAGNIAYTVTATDKNSCPDTAHINLTFIMDENKVYIPSAFTPNGDGSNDSWGVLSERPLGYFNLQVFNRWGVNVYNVQNQGAKWNGTVKNAKAPPGTYVYVLSYKNGNGCAEQKTKGTVLLMR